MIITKSDYVLWRECPHNAWMKKWKPEIYFALPLSDFEKHLVEAGNSVEKKARERFPGGVLVESRGDESLKQTKELLKDHTETLFQASFSDGILFAAVDILKRGKNGELSLYEVKASSSSKLEQETEDESDDGDRIVDFKDPKALEKYKNKLLKDHHLYDLAFQVYLARKVGYKVVKAYLIRLNKNYTLAGEVDLQKLFVFEDVTIYVEEISLHVKEGIEIMINLLSSPKEPSGPCRCIYEGRSKHCTTFAEHNRKILKDDELLKYSVHDLIRIRSNKLHELINLGVYDIKNIPDDFELSPKMQKQADVHNCSLRLKPGDEKADINHKLIRQEFAKLQFPLYFLDYESFNPAIPRFNGYKPYQHIPFQYSLHVLTKESAEKGAEPEHMEPFFYIEKNDPSPLFVTDLKKKIGKSGSIIVWNRTFEESHINKHLAIRLPEYADFIQGVNSRIFDLMKIFSKQLHVHPDFHGRASIKKILNVLCPKLSYKELDISNGSEAMNTWNKLVTEDMVEAKKEELKQSMLEYCELDTYAMYAIWKHLSDIVK
ncbi:MAG: DUF2779 domain-containing protein [Patescibacteria group bacterium]